MSKNYSSEELLYMYRHLKNGRLFTLKMHECVTKGLIRSSFHTPWGQEAVGVAIGCAMKDTDWMGFTHRLQTALIMRYPLEGFIGELFALRAGIKHGSAFDFHLVDLKEDGLRVLPMMAVLGGTLPTGCGFMQVRKMMGKDEVGVLTTGDAAASEGATYETWNLAALYKPPVSFVIDNNEWGMTVPIERQTYVKDISKKAEGCGLPGVIVDGTDILAIREAMDESIAMARECQPNVVETKSLRWEAHFVGQGSDYRKGYDMDKVEESQKKSDCVIKYEDYLMKEGLIDQKYIDNLTEELTTALDEAVDKVSQSEKPHFDDIYRKEYIYASPETGGDL